MVRDKKIKIFFVKGSFSNPNSASFNRFLMIVKMTGRYFDYEVLNNNVNGINKYERSKIINALFMRLNIVKSILSIPSSKTKQINILFLFSTSPLIALISYLFAKPRKIKIITERNEYPEIIRSNVKWKIFIYKAFVIWWQFRIFDAMFLITDNLIEFYKKYTSKRCIIQKLPMTVDFERFKNISNRSTKEYIFYAGSLSQKKDGILYLIKAFGEISKEHPNLKLKIAGGNPKSNDAQLMEKIISMLNIEDKVQFLGVIDRDRVPLLLSNAKILVLARPDTIQARGGFPTKLGEYLASGRPTIVTKVGEIEKMLTNKDVFFISPINIVEELKMQIRAILRNYDFAVSVARHGKITAFKKFSIEQNSIFIKKMINALVI